MEKRRPADIARDPNATLKELDQAAHDCPATVRKNPVVKSGLLALENPAGAERLDLRARLVLVERAIPTTLRTLFPKKTLSLLLAEERQCRPLYPAAAPDLSWFWAASDRYAAGEFPAKEFWVRTTRLGARLYRFEMFERGKEPRESYYRAIRALREAALAQASESRPNQLPKHLSPEMRRVVEAALLRFAEYHAGLPPREYASTYKTDEEPNRRFLAARERQLIALKA
jgi:hypothetical protein